MSNNDNAMARFLFAILQQKCLKDIDWNKVASDPVLAQKITNGHAARMRYSRFRAAMLGLEPQRRNRTNPDKSRVSKKKKDDGVKVKKEDGDKSTDNVEIKREDETTTAPTIKTERRSIAEPSRVASQPQPRVMSTTLMNSKPGPGHSQHNSYTQHHPSSILSAASPNIKQEGLPANASPAAPMAKPYPFGIATTAATTSPSPANTAATSAFNSNHANSRSQMRLLTPCSDSDVMQGSGNGGGFISHNPANDLLHHQQANNRPHQSPAASAPPSPFDFVGCDVGAGHGSGSPWHSQHHYPTHVYHGHPSPASVYSAGYAMGTGGGGGGGGAYGLDTSAITANNATAPSYMGFCAEHPHHSHQREEEGHDLGLGLHTGSMFRERELEMRVGMDTLDSQGSGVKHEWEAGKY